MQDLTLVNHLIPNPDIQTLYLPEEKGWFKLLWVESLHKKYRKYRTSYRLTKTKIRLPPQKTEQVNYCVIKYSGVLSMLGNRFPDWGGGRVF